MKRKTVFRLYIGGTTSDYFFDELAAHRAAELIKQLTPAVIVKVRRGWVYA